MCGLAGRFHHLHIPPDLDWGQRASELLAHRGPDGKGYYVDNWCELVHRRLALIDLSPTGAQPMPNEDGSVQVVFNGEIYNHAELRKVLQKKGHSFRGSSDTEVLPHLYEEYGAELASHLKGMFAFAIYDQKGRRLLLSRDRFGIKPLFYSVQENQVIFGSEIKAILAASAITRDVDRQACYDFLGLTYIPEPASGFTNIKMLTKGTTIIFDVTGMHQTKLPLIRAQPESRDLDEAADLIEDTLLQAVTRQKVADVPVAALLSGGIDSSLIVAALCRTSSELPTTFNVRFPDKAYDETEFALRVAQQYQTRHHTLELRSDTLTPTLVLELLRHFDQPFADSSLIPTYLISKMVRDSGIVCTLSGDGGDEAFGGYASFWRANQLIRLMHLPRLVTDALSISGRQLTRWSENFGRQLAKAVDLAVAGRNDSARLLAGLSNYLNENQKRELVLPTARESLREIYYQYYGYSPAGVSDLEELSRRLTENFFGLGLPSDMLRKVDMMSMKAGIEVRVPMLDEEMVSIGLSLSHRLKTDGRNGKRVLRRLAGRWLPEQVSTHPKQGFGIPLDRMATPEFHGMLNDILLSRTAKISSFLNMSLIRNWLDLFKGAAEGKYSGRISRGGLYQRVFMILSLESWLQEQNLTW